jgi:type IV pilus assembly protein PilX
MRHLPRETRVSIKQKGLVLFIALIALVAMSLAAVALIRSVDSNVLAAGNLAFKQSALMSAETGVARAYKYINDNATSLTANGVGYYATYNDTLNLTADSSWTTANSIPVTNALGDTSGNTVRLVIQRMCRNNGDVTQENCLVGVGTSAANSKGNKSEGGGAGGGGFGGAKGSADAVVFRATVRVAGPRNTVSYLQAFIY